MAVDVDVVPSRVSGRTKIPSIRAREAAEVTFITNAASKKKRALPRQSTSTPTTSGFSALSQSPRGDTRLVLNRNISVPVGRQEKRAEAELEEEACEDDGKVYCICRGPDDGRSPMIYCDNCEDW